MREFYDDRLNAADAISTLADNVKGKYLMEKGCVKPYYAGRPFCEGITLYLADEPGQSENETISFLPGLNKDGSVCLKVICCAVNQTDKAAYVRKNEWTNASGMRKCHADLEEQYELFERCIPVCWRN